jgi:leucine-rich repeat protein SHOC2
VASKPKSKFTSWAEALPHAAECTELILDPKQVPPRRYQAKRVPPEIARFTALRKLRLKKDRFNALGEEIAACTALEEIEVQESDYAFVVGPELGRLPKLRVLRLEFCGITVLEGQWGSLPALEVLSLHGNLDFDLERSIDALAGLPRLQELDLSRIPLQDIGGLGRLPSLRRLLLENSKNGYVVDFEPPHRGLDQLSRLEGLDISNNGYSLLPAEVFGLARLQTLNLSCNALLGLPPEIGRLRELRTLRCGGNLPRKQDPGARFTLPEALGELSMLEELVLRYNVIDELPESIGRLSRLRRLDLTATGLCAFPETFFSLQLEELEVDDLPEGTLRRVHSTMPHCKITTGAGAKAEAYKAAMLKFYRVSEE